MSESKLSPGRLAFYIVVLFVCVIILYFLLGKGLKAFQVPSRSMEPTLYPSDFIFTEKGGAYARGDIVVFNDPEDPGSYLVKRIVALGGDRVMVDFGALYLNGEFVSEPYIKEQMNYTLPEYQVPEGRVFVLGDNRNESDDSAVWFVSPKEHPFKAGVPLSEVVGRVTYRYLPLSRAGRVKSYPLATAGQN